MTKLKKIILLIFLGLFLSAQAYSEQVMSLKTCFDLALKQSETIASSNESIKKAEGELQQVVGSSLPEFSFRYTSTWQDQSGLDATYSNFAKSPQPEAAFRMQLPIFNGYRELAAIRSGSSLVKQYKEERRHAELLLFIDVAQSYYATILSQKNLSTVQKALELSLNRLKELSGREKLGRSRKAELLDMEAKVAILKAQEQDAKLTYDTAKNLLEFLIGEPLEGGLKEAPSTPAPTPIEEYLTTINNRPDIQAKKDATKVAKGVLQTAKADHLPQLDVNANYYVDRTGFREPIDWDLTFGVTVPLWSWGATQGAVHEASSTAKQAKLDEELAIRRAELEIKDAYNRYSSSFKKVDLQNTALDLTHKSYTTRTEEYRHGLVNNLEVLDALDRFYQAEINYNAAYFDNIISYLKLETTAGKLPEDY